VNLVKIVFASSLTGSTAVDLALVATAATAATLLLYYRRPLVLLSRGQRVTLATIRGLAVAATLALLLRPVAVLPPASSRDVVVPVLVDASRSMSIADADGQTRIAQAKSIAQFELVPELAKKYRVTVLAVGDGLVETPAAALEPGARRSDLASALAQVHDRFRGQQVAGIVLVSDGADTGRPDGRRRTNKDDSTTPVFAVGVGAASGLRDREVLSIVAGEQRLEDASIDVHVSSSSAGFGRAPYDVRLLANGAVVETHRVAPAADGSPDQVAFTVFPDAFRDTVYTAEIQPAAGETIRENNARSLLVRAAGRRRRVLVVAGAPGFEHSFMMRAWSLDAGLEVDSVVRKGKNAEGRDTFVIQAARDRTQNLASGFPAKREGLYAYDAVVVANIEGSFFMHDQLTLLADFVSERGGGLLVAGGRSLAQHGLIGTPLEAVLPVELDDRRGTVARAALGNIERAAPNQLAVTAEGATHPIMRLGASGDDTRMRWAALPALAASTPLGQARPGASVLAVVSAPDGGVFPVVAVQRYGKGRSMIFGGEASWRWRMLAASTDRSHELFWRQAARWLSQSAPDPVSIGVPDDLEPGDAAPIEIDARDSSFAAASDASVTASISVDGGETRTLPVHRDDRLGRFAGTFAPERPGVYRLHADASRGAVALGSADRTVYVGGSDREFADPRLNEGLLRRVAADSGGRYVRASDASRVLSWLDDSARQNTAPERRDVWDRGWVFAGIVLLLCAEWTLRRRWGLR
jgi:uncharacterized membrane protein